jgi:hypothetical protein
MSHEVRVQEGFMAPGQRQSDQRQPDPSQWWAQNRRGTWERTSPEGAQRWQTMGRTTHQGPEPPA